MKEFLLRNGELFQGVQSSTFKTKRGASGATFLTKQAIVANTPKPSQAAIFDLKEVESKTRKAGLLQLALEAKFARGSLLSGVARSSELRAVADEAKQHGYLLLARRAETAVKA